MPNAIMPRDNMSLIVAIADNLAIGKDNNLLWHISDDLRRFKSLTSGHAVIMGRRTFFSLPRRPLPNRRNIVITHSVDFSHPGVEVAHSINRALQLTEQEQEAFVIGGSDIYRQFLPLVSKMYVTRVHATFEADTFFPAIDPSLFCVVQQTEAQTDSQSGLSFSYVEYQRRAVAPNNPLI